MSLMALRQRSGQNRESICSFLGVTLSTIYRWEKGITKPDDTQAKQLADALGCTINDVVNAIDEQARQQRETA